MKTKERVWKRERENEWVRESKREGGEATMRIRFILNSCYVMPKKDA